MIFSPARLRTRRTTVTTAVAALAALLLPLVGIAPAAVAAEQETRTLYETSGSPSFVAGLQFDFLGTRVVVPAGEQWVLTSVTLPELSVNPLSEVAVYADERGGDATARLTPLDRQPAVLAAPGSTTLTLDPVTLWPGTYYVSFIQTRSSVFLSADSQLLRINALGGIVTRFDGVEIALTLSGTSTPLTQVALHRFDALAADGTLVGSGPGRSAQERFGALRSMLVAAVDLQAAGDTDAACDQLASARQRLHTTGPVLAQHFATGSGAGGLSALLEEVRTALCD